MCKLHELIILIVDKPEKIEHICKQIMSDTGSKRLLCATDLESAVEFSRIKEIDVVLVNEGIDPDFILPVQTDATIIYYGDKTPEKNVNAYLNGASQFVGRDFGEASDIFELATKRADKWMMHSTRS